MKRDVGPAGNRRAFPDVSAPGGRGKGRLEQPAADVVRPQIAPERKGVVGIVHAQVGEEIVDQNPAAGPAMPTQCPISWMAVR